MAVGLFIWTTLWWQLRYVQLFEYMPPPLLCAVVFGSTLNLCTIQLVVSRYWDRPGIITSPHSTMQLSTNCISVTNICKKDLGLLLRTESRSHLWNRLLAHEGWLYLSEIPQSFLRICCFIGFSSLYQIFFCFKKWQFVFFRFSLSIILSNLKHLNICWLAHKSL